MTEPTDDLQQRCAEIVEWQRTGVLPGDALRNYAAANWAGRHDSLQMAERDTAAQAMERIAKFGTPPAEAPWRSTVLDLIDECPGLTMEQDQWLSRRVKELDFASAPQPTQAQAVAVPLTDEQIGLMAFNDDPGDWNELAFRECWVEGYKTGARSAEAAHGIGIKGGRNVDHPV